MITSFTNVAAMKASALPAANDTAILLGYYVAGDSGGGDFYWDSASIETEDGGTIFQITGVTTGRWKRAETATFVSVRWFGAKGDGTTDDTLALNACASYCKAGTYRRTMFFADGNYLTGRVDITGVFVIRGEGDRVKLTGKPCHDILYWKGMGEPGYVAAKDVYISHLYMEVDASKDVRSSYLRVGFEGERIGNCAIHIGQPTSLSFDQIRINAIGGPGSGPAYGCCGIFFSGQAYQVNFGTKTEVRQADYGVIVGTSEYYTPIIPAVVTALDPATGTFTVANSYAAGFQVVLVYDHNDGSVDGLTRRTQKYYVVNPTATTVQLAATAGGTPLTFSVTGTPAVYLFPSGSSTLEFACDEWAWQQLVTVTKRVGFSAANLSHGSFGAFGCQSNYVAVRVLNYQSATNNQCHTLRFNDMYTEGPLYTTLMVSKEYVCVEGQKIFVGNGPYCSTNSVLNNYISINAIDSEFNYINVKNNYLRINGRRNRFNVLSETGETLVQNYGPDNVINLLRRSNGDAVGTPNVLSRHVTNKPFGGIWPDYIRTGNTASPYQSDNVLFQVAIDVNFQSNPVIENRYDDATLDVNGYVRKPTSGTLAQRSPFGSNQFLFTAGVFFPQSRWRLYAKVRSLTTTQNLTIAFTRTGGTGFSGSAVYSVGTSWTVISLELDHTTAPAGMTGDLSVASTTEGFDLAYFYIMPFTGEDLVIRTNFGGNLLDLTGTGTPEAAVTAAVGSTYRRRDGAAGSTFYVKQTGTGNTGWAAIA